MAANAPKSPYQAAIAKLLTLADFERKSRAGQPPDWHLKRVARLMQLLGDPHLAKPVVHVAGSKGKGSTSAFITSALIANGYRTGHYTSPHLHRFTERISVDRKPIAETQFASLVDQLWPLTEQIAAQGDIGTVSVFEMLTAMAFVHFRDHADVDIAVIEVGLGGRLDATNLVRPVVSVITPISLDHVPVLGDTISEIAVEKAGIIKRGVPVVMGRQSVEAAAVIKERAKELECNLHDAMREVTVIPADEGDIDDEHRGDATLHSDFGQINCDLPMLGSHQLDNARTAVATLQVLAKSGFNLSADRIERGLTATVWPCRTELIRLTNGVLVLLDGAHNDASARALVNTICTHLDLRHRKVTLILGATAGHDSGAVARAMLQLRPANVIATSSRHPKSLPPDQVEIAAKGAGLHLFAKCGTVNDSIVLAKNLALSDAGDLIVATGSLFVAAEAREHILNIEPELYDDIPSSYMHPYDAPAHSRQK